MIKNDNQIKILNPLDMNHIYGGLISDMDVSSVINGCGKVVTKACIDAEVKVCVKVEVKQCMTFEVKCPSRFSVKTEDGKSVGW